jgi:hypothetical protein
MDDDDDDDDDDIVANVVEVEIEKVVADEDGWGEKVEKEEMG